MSFNTLNNILSNAQTYGAIHRTINLPKPPSSTTAANANCGGITGQRMPVSLNIFGGTSSSPSLGASVTGGYITQLRVASPLISTLSILGIEYQMGQVTANGGTGTFVDGSALPTKSIVNAGGTSVTIAPLMIFAYVSTTMVGAGTYTLTITYANQDGTGGRTATLTIPNVSVVNSAFDVIPHLQGDDTTMTDITGITLTGTSGVIKIMALFPVGWSSGTSVDDYNVATDPLTCTFPFFKIENTDTLAFYRLGAQWTSEAILNYTIVPEI